ncbi:hypothetical protein EVAR_30368_1 [Eumeta japonica]|uniref:Uncharacterized protein n=1 Tax=Eumeta variegata TaxID=151549 RepID=A0A4C1W5Q2_EUMVA|nr:hypothetical protein EVAR_30368_1 [Eumeta japonica]
MAGQLAAERAAAMELWSTWLERENSHPPPQPHLLSIKHPSIGYPIPDQEADSTPVTILRLRVSMGGDDYSLPDGLQARRPLENAI